MDEIVNTWLKEQGFKENNPNQSGKNGDSPLIIASRAGDVDMVGKLIRAGADVNHKNNDNNNAIWGACFADSLPVIQILAKAGTDIDNQNVNGATALIYAASAGKDEMVAALLDLDANPALKTLDDYTALESASTPKAFKLLKNL